ncbi:MAG: hypothetical protein SGJ00_12120 [bacterium]|nr:hypothetical protein [bacterium]
MKLRTISYLIISWLPFFAKAQLTMRGGKCHLLGVSIRSDMVMPLEVSYLNLNHKYFNFQIKGSMRRANRGDVSPIYMQTSYANFGPYYSRGRVDFESSYYYIKPGLVLANSKHAASRFLFCLNGILGYSKDQMQIRMFDPLIGYTNQKHNETHTYYGAELEINYMADLGKNVGLSFGGFINGSLNKPKPFESLYNRAFNGRDYYYPSLGFAHYTYGCNLGLVFKIRNRGDK